MLGPILLTVAGAWFGFPNPWLHLPPAVLLFPAGLAVIAGTAGSPKRAFKLGWFAGTLAYGVCIYWVSLPVHNYAFLPWILAAPCPILLGLVLGLYAGVFTLLVASTEGRLHWFAQALFTALLWGALEWVRSWLFTGFPWLGLASAFSFWPIAVQGVALVGGYGMAAWLAMGAVLLARCVLPGGVKGIPLILAVLVLAAPFFYGRHALNNPPQPVDTANIGMVQGNIDQGVKWDDNFKQGTVERYTTMSSSLALEQTPRRLDLVVWPETAMPFYFQEAGTLSASVRRMARDLNLPVLLGAPGFEKLEGRDYLLFNRAFLLNTSGETTGFYEKEHLVPFGEYVPLQNLLPFLNKLVPGSGDFAPGKRIEPLMLNRLALGVLICYEAIFPELAQKRVEQGANVLVNISNDAWYGRSSAAAQHLSLALLRCIEQGRSMVRATNTGLSAIIGPQGRILAEIGLFTPRAAAAEVGLYTYKTPFHRIQKYVAPVLCITALLLLVIGLILKRPAPAAGQIHQ